MSTIALFRMLNNKQRILTVFSTARYVDALTRKTALDRSRTDRISLTYDLDLDL